MSLILHIHLLGDFRLNYDDTLVTTVNTPRLQSLLAYLVLHRQAPQSRSHLAFLLWPDSTEAQARTNLRHQFHLLRQALPEAGRFLQADVQTLQWRPDAPFSLDVADFESATAPSASLMALQEATDLYRGDLLPSCYDEWILPERERLRQRFMAALERLIGLLENEHDYALAIRYAHRLGQVDPLNETTYRHLMGLYALNGDQAGVQRTYQECITVLQGELGAEPSPATRAAYERLLNLNVSHVPPHNLPTHLTPFIGRETELAELTELLSDPTIRLITILGPGGIGKTRLAIEVAARQHQTMTANTYFVSLESADSPDDIVTSIAKAIGFQFQGQFKPKQQLFDGLRNKNLILILDNPDHLLESGVLVGEILASSLGIKILTTSRERLRLRGEQIFLLKGLDTRDKLRV